MLEVLDTAGQEEYTALRDQWIRDGEGFVLVYSIASRASFSRIRKFYHQIQRVKESASAASPTGTGYLASSMAQPASYTGQAPVMLVGNKSDRVTEREVSTQEGSALAKDMGCDFVEASAKNCINVEKAFYEVVRSLRRQRQEAPIPRRGTLHSGRDGTSIPGTGSRGLKGHGIRPGKDRDGKSKPCVIL